MHIPPDGVGKTQCIELARVIGWSALLPYLLYPRASKGAAAPPPRKAAIHHSMRWHGYGSRVGEGPKQVNNALCGMIMGSAWRPGTRSPLFVPACLERLSSTTSPAIV